MHVWNVWEKKKGPRRYQESSIKIGNVLQSELEKVERVENFLNFSCLTFNGLVGIDSASHAAGFQQLSLSGSHMLLPKVRPPYLIVYMPCVHV